MAGVTALQNFEHDGAKRRGDFFEVSDHIAKKLKARGLVVMDSEAQPLRPYQAAGERLSALPVVRVLPQTIVKKSKSGKTRNQGAG